MKYFYIIYLLFFCYPSFAIYNMQTNTEELPKVDKKHWLLVAQACLPCLKALTSLKNFCSGKKPSPSRIGFLATGNNPKYMLKKLVEFKNYEIFSGSPNEFYEHYKLMATPSLKIKAKNKSVSGTYKILNFLKKDPNFCSS